MRLGKSLIAPLTLLVLALPACGSDEPTPNAGGNNAAPAAATKVRIAGNSNAAVLPVWVGIDKGYFKDCGVDAEFTKVENISTLPAALGRSFDIALSVPPLLINAASQGLPVVEVAGATINTRDNPQTFLVAREGSGITSVKDLAGKTLGAQTLTGSTHLGTKLWLQREGVPYESVKVVQVDGPAQADQLRAGRVDAMETLAPFSTSVLKLGTSIIDPQASVAPTVSGIFWTSSTQWANENKEALTCFRDGLGKGKEFIEGNETAAKTVLQQRTELPADVVQETKLPTYTPETRPEDLKLWEDAMKQVGGFKGDVDTDALVLTD